MIIPGRRWKRRSRILSFDNDNENEEYEMVVKWTVIKNERTDLLKFDVLNLSLFLKFKFYVNNGLQGKRYVVHLDDLDISMLWCID